MPPSRFHVFPGAVLRDPVLAVSRLAPRIVLHTRDRHLALDHHPSWRSVLDAWADQRAGLGVEGDEPVQLSSTVWVRPSAVVSAAWRPNRYQDCDGPPIPHLVRDRIEVTLTNGQVLVVDHPCLTPAELVALLDDCEYPEDGTPDGHPKLRQREAPVKPVPPNPWFRVGAANVLAERVIGVAEGRQGYGEIILSGTFASSASVVQSGVPWVELDLAWSGYLAAYAAYCADQESYEDALDDSPF